MQETSCSHSAAGGSLKDHGVWSRSVSYNVACKKLHFHPLAYKFYAFTLDPLCLLQIPKGRFCLLFFAIYLFQVQSQKKTYQRILHHDFAEADRLLICLSCLQYATFGLLYYLQAEHCIKGVKHYLHALWFSVQTSATIGYGGDLIPNPSCSVTNALVTCQVIISLLTDYSMLGIVFTRFSNPTSRVSTIRFSKQMAMTNKNGLWHLTFRVANIRKHQILRPEICILLLRFNSRHPDADDAGYLHQV